jgi:T5orf172 domain
LTTGERGDDARPAATHGKGTLLMNTHPMDYAAIEVQPGLAGNVYFLAPVNFENAAFCKIGRAKNDPEARCAQINKSSTGDVLWGVRHVVTVDDHIRFERLVHQLLASSRNHGAGQRREIFHLAADDAFARACEMLAHLPDIKEIPVVISAPVVKARRATASGGAKGHVIKKGDEVYFPLFMSWARRLEIKGGGKPFGQWKSSGFGYSDDVKGVQWNIGVDRNTGEIRLGVNLEGSAKGGGNWLISDFILSELDGPTIESIKAKIGAGRIQLTLARDAWQGASRYDIVEHLIGRRRFLLSEIDTDLWRRMLIEAKGCLDPSRQFRGRAAQTVTLLNTGEKRLLEPPVSGVSPHLNANTLVEAEPGWDDDRLDAAMDQAITRLRPVYEWVSRTAK